MGVPIWLNSGPCPSVAQVYGTLQVGRPPRSGFMEFGTYSNPPNIYQVCSLSGGPLHASWVGHTIAGNSSSPTTGSGHNTLTPFSQIDVTWNNTSEFGYSGTLNDNTFEEVNGVTTTTTDNKYTWSDLTGPVRASELDGSAVASASSLGDMPLGNLTEPSGEDPAVFAASSLTDATITVTEALNKWIGSTLWQVTGVTIALALSSPDTDANAIARAAFDGVSTESGDPTDHYGFSGQFFSLYETRKNIGSSPAIRFGYQTGTYQVQLANLLTSIAYTVTVQWEQRTAAGNGSGDTSLYGTTWADADTQTISFVASGSTQITDAQALPLAAGYQKRIKSISIAGACS